MSLKHSIPCLMSSYFIVVPTKSWTCWPCRRWKVVHSLSPLNFDAFSSHLTFWCRKWFKRRALFHCCPPSLPPFSLYGNWCGHKEAKTRTGRKKKDGGRLFPRPKHEPFCQVEKYFIWLFAFISCFLSKNHERLYKNHLGIAYRCPERVEGAPCWGRMHTFTGSAERREDAEPLLIMDGLMEGSSGQSIASVGNTSRQFWSHQSSRVFNQILLTANSSQQESARQQGHFELHLGEIPTTLGSRK